MRRRLEMRALRRALPSTLVLSLVLAGACGSVRPEARPPSGTTTAAPTTVPLPPTVSAPPTTQPPPTTVLPPTTLPAAPTAPDLGVGDTGPRVRALEQRLATLGYWAGANDARFDGDTLHAVVALQKAAGLPRTGRVGPSTEAALDTGARPAPHSVSGRVIEIDLRRQLLVIVVDGRAIEIFDTSTGSAHHPTPAGHWTITRQIDGLRRSPLGLLYRPKYFHSGIAVHGYTSVPSYPASHGCVRVTYHAMDHIWAAGLAPVGTAVWIF